MPSVYFCPSCNRGYAFKEENSPAGPLKCEYCGGTPLQQAEDWEIFKCSICNSDVDVTTLKMHLNLNRIPEGLIRCKYDDEPLYIQS